MATSDELTTAQAGELLGVTQERVQQFISEGRLPGRKPARDWLIPREAVEAFAQLERPAGNPNFRQGALPPPDPDTVEFAKQAAREDRGGTIDDILSDTDGG